MSISEAESYSLNGIAHTMVADVHQKGYGLSVSHEDILSKSPPSIFDKEPVHLNSGSLSRALSDLRNADNSLKALTIRTVELCNQNNSFLQTLLANNSQLNSLCTELSNVKTTISNANSLISQCLLLQSISPPISANSPQRSSSLPECIQRSHYTVNTHEMATKSAHVEMTQLTNASHYQNNPSPGRLAASLQPSVTLPFDQHLNAQEKHEVAAVLAASAAAEVVSEQYGLPNTDQKFYNKVLMKLLSPQPNINGGNWNPHLTAQTNDIDVFKDTITKTSQVPPQLDPKVISNFSNNNINHSFNNLPQGTLPLEKPSPVGPGATLTFKGTRDTSSYLSMPTDNAIAKMHFLLDNVIQSGAKRADPVSPLAVFPANDAPITELTIENSRHEANTAPVIVASEQPSELHSPMEENSPYQSPQLLSADPQMLIAKSDCSPTAAASRFLEVPGNLDKINSSIDNKAKPPRKRTTSKPSFKSVSKSRPESKPRPKSRSKSQPISRSNSYCDSIPKHTFIPSGSSSPQRQTSRADTTRKRAKSISAMQTPRRQDELSTTSVFNISSDIHVGSTTTASSLTSMSLSTVGTRPGTKPLSRASSQPLTATRIQNTSYRAKVNRLLEKYSTIPNSDVMSETAELRDTSCQRKIDYQQIFTSVISFMQFFLDSGNYDPLSPIPTNDLLTNYAVALCEKISQIPMDNIGKDLIRIAEWMAEQLSSEHFFEYITSESFIADYFTHIPKTLPEISAELTAYNRRRKEDYDKSLIEYEVERKKGSPRLKYMDKPEEPKKYTMDQFHVAFKRSIRNMWSPELERELIYYFHGKYMDMTATEGIILQEWIDHNGDLSKSIFPGHNLYNYKDFFNKNATSLSKIAEDSSLNKDNAVSYDLYFYYCLLSIYLLLNDCFPIRFNIYYMNYKMFQGVFRYINPEDLETPMSMGSNFRLYWPAWKDVRRGTLRFHCKFLEIKKNEKPAKTFLRTTGSFSKGL